MFAPKTPRAITQAQHDPMTEDSNNLTFELNAEAIRLILLSLIHI